METYEIYLNGSLVSSTPLAGIAYLRFKSARLLGAASLVRVSHNPDPVLGGKYLYNIETGGWESATDKPTPADTTNTEAFPQC